MKDMVSNEAYSNRNEENNNGIELSPTFKIRCIEKPIGKNNNLDMVEVTCTGTIDGG